MNRQKIFIVVITLMMLIASAQIVCAEDDILSGVFHGVNWRITSEHELIIGKDGYNQEFDYIDPDDDLDWPWKDALLTSCRFEGNVISNGALDYMFYDCNSLKSIDFTNLSTSNTTSLEGLFENCNKLASINFADIDTSKVIDFSGMFDNCKSLSNIDLSQFDTSQAVGFSSMFRDCDSLSNIDLSKLDTSKAESMDFMFSGCGQITELDVSGFDTSNVRFMGSMFESIPYLTTLDLSNFDTSNVVHMGWMFRGCFRLKNLNISSFDTKNVLYMTQMFDGCEDLESLDVSSFDTSNVLNMELLFSRCTHLKELDLSSFDMSSVTNASGMIQRYNLKTLITPRNVNLDIPLGGVMYDLNGGQYSALPKNGPSMVLVRDEPVYIVNNNVTEEMLYGEYAYYLNNRAFKSIVGKLADVEYEIIWNRVSNHLTLSALKTTLRQGAGKNFITFLTHLNGKTPHEDELEEEIARELMLTVQGNDDTLTEVIEFSNQNFTWMDFAYSLPKNFYKFDSEIKKLVDKYAEMSGKSKTYSEKAVKNILKGQKKYSDTSDDIIDLAQYGIDAGDAIIAGLATEQINEATVDYLLNEFRDDKDTPIYRGLKRIKNKLNDPRRYGAEFFDHMMQDLVASQAKELISKGVDKSTGGLFFFGDLACKGISYLIPGSTIDDMNKLAIISRNYNIIDKALIKKYAEIILNYRDGLGKDPAKLRSDYKILYTLKMETLKQGVPYAEKVGTKEQARKISIIYDGCSRLLNYDQYIKNCLRNANMPYVYRIENGVAILKGVSSTGNRTLRSKALQNTDEEYSFIDLPEKVDELNVAAVDSNAFDTVTDINYLFIPQSVKSIGDNAFCGCSGLREVFIEDDPSLGEEVFVDCSNDLTINAGESTIVNEYAADAGINTDVKEPEVVGIKVDAYPDKTAYELDDDADSSGMKVFAIYQDGTEKDVTEDSVCFFRERVPGNSKAVIAYMGFEEEYDVTFNNACSYTIKCIDEKGNRIRNDISAESEYGQIVSVDAPDVDGYDPIEANIDITADYGAEAIFIYHRGTAIDINNASVTISDCEYDDNTFEPQIILKYNGKDLVEYKDYTVLFNVTQNTGTAYISGTGDYTGEMTASFRVVKKSSGTDSGGQTVEPTPGSSSSNSAITHKKELIDLPAIKILTIKPAKKSFTIKWKKLSKKNLNKIAKIQIQYSTDKSFKKGVKTVTVKKTTISKKLKKLKAKKKYYVRVRAYKKVGSVVHVSKWSKRKPVKTK